MKALRSTARELAKSERSFRSTTQTHSRPAMESYSTLYSVAHGKDRPAVAWRFSLSFWKTSFLALSFAIVTFCVDAIRVPR
jgi:hypothetical protein